MEQGKASKTAEAVAALRAAESIKPIDERICFDPFAKRFLGFKYSLLNRILSSNRILTKIGLWYVSWYAERVAPGGFAYVASRCRYLDDYLKDCIDDGIQQLVILGAGYDTRAYRFDKLRDNVKVFEVDHPDTQVLKKAKVRKIFGSLTPHVTYVPVDFNRENLAEKLFDNDYDISAKTLFIWEGVTPFIDAEAVDETLAFVSRNSGQDSSIIFDYMYKSQIEETSNLEEAKKDNRYSARVGEPNTFGIEEGTIEEFLRKRGFEEIRNVTWEDFTKLYFNGPNKNRTTRRLMALAHANVNPPA